MRVSIGRFASLFAVAAMAASATVAGAAVSLPGPGESWPRSVAQIDERPMLISDPAPMVVTPAVIMQTPIGINQAAWTEVSAEKPATALPKSVERSIISRILDAQKAVESLAGVGDDESGNPLVDFSYLSAGPSSFTMVRSGQPGGQATMWSHTANTALSYVRPHRNLEFVMNFHSVENGSGQSGLASQAQFIDGSKVDIDSNQMVQASSMYGNMSPAVEKDKPHPGRMVAFGLDLGLIPAVLADVGISTTITIGESINPGPFVSVATNIEVSNQRTRELTADNEYQVAVDLTSAAGVTRGLTFGSGFAAEDGGTTGGGGGGGGGGDGPTPITPDPPVPEPASLLLLALGGAVIVARRRQKENRR